MASGQDRPNVSRSIFMPWVIRPFDGINSKDLAGLRMHSDSANPLLNTPEPGLLMAGWHNIRHTLNLKGDGKKFGSSARRVDQPVVFSDTELIVIADYGPVRGAQLKDVSIDRDLRKDFG